MDREGTPGETPEEFFKTLKEVQYTEGGPEAFIRRFWPSEFLVALRAQRRRSKLRSGQELGGGGGGRDGGL